MENQKYAVAYFQGKHPYLTSGKPYKTKDKQTITDDEGDSLFIIIGRSYRCWHLAVFPRHVNGEVKTLEEIYEDQKEQIRARCPECSKDDARTNGSLTFAGSRDEPAEYKSKCQFCGHEVDDIDWEDGYETFEEWTDRTEIG